jgi:thiol-disulfide isomerase/thioredoxin
LKAVLRIFLTLSLSATGLAAGIDSVRPEQFRARVVAPHRGRVLAVNFWATWCEPCRQEMPDLVEAARETAREGLDVVLVSADFRKNLPAVESFLGRFRVPFRCFLEESEDPQTFIDAVDPKWGGELPHTIVYDRTGAARISLSSRQTRQNFERAFRKVLAGDVRPSAR